MRSVLRFKLRRKIAKAGSTDYTAVSVPAQHELIAKRAKHTSYLGEGFSEFLAATDDNSEVPRCCRTRRPVAFTSSVNRESQVRFPGRTESEQKRQAQDNLSAAHHISA